MPVIAVIAAASGVSAVIGAAAATAIGLGTVGTVAATAIGSGIIAGATTAVMGGDASDVLESAVVGGVTSYVGGTVAPAISSAVTEATGSAIAGNIAGNVAATAITGGDEEDILKSGLLSGIGTAIEQEKLDLAEEYLKSIPPSQTYESDLPTLNVVPGDTVGIVEAPITVDTSFTPDYSLSPVAPVIPEMGAQGIQVPTINEVIDVVNQPVDYSLTVPESNIGLTIPPVLGDESSFINQPVPEVSVNIPEIVEQPKDISGELAALDVAKSLAPVAAGALTAGAVVNAIQEDQPTGFEIVPIPADWRSPEYNMAFVPSAPIDFGTAELLRGTQWQNPQIQAPRQYTLTDVINALNYQSVPFVQQNYEIPQVQMSIPEILEQFNVAPTVGVNDIIGNLGGRPMSIADIISGIQSGQNYGS